MAHVVDSIGQPRQVPWAEFADGRVWELVRADSADGPGDFDQDAEHARRAAMAWAARHGLAIRTSVLGPDRLRVQICPRT